MTKQVLIVAIACFYSAYIFFDAMAVIARSSASLLGRNAFGAAIEKMMNTLKRTMIFCYPPLLGYFVISDDQSSIFISIGLSYAFACLLLIILIKHRAIFVSYFYGVAQRFSSGSGIFASFVSRAHGEIPSNQHKGHGAEPSVSFLSELLHLKNNLFLLSVASWVYFVFGASIFPINLLALRFADFAPIILQSLGLINGMGTLVLAFLVDPIVSRYLDSSEKLDEVMIALLSAQLVASLIIAPVFFAALFLSL